MKWLILGMAASAATDGCDKRETSTPHTDIEIALVGIRTEPPKASSAAGWAVRFERFRVAPTIGIDESSDHDKGDGYVALSGREAYVFGGELFDLALPGPKRAFTGFVLSGTSSGWGMRLRRFGSARGLPKDRSLEVAGVAIGPKGEVRFDWAFSDEPLFSHCRASGSNSLLLPENGRLFLEVGLDPTALLTDHQGTDQQLDFEPITRADSDGDGTVTTAELRSADLSELGLASTVNGGESRTLYELMSARLSRLVTPAFTCTVEMTACRDRPVTYGICDGTDQAEKDADADGISNCLDEDIDDDGQSNDEDCDPYSSAESLSVCDGSDRQEKDTDGDGSRNCDDPDIDGDGILNENDGRPYDDAYDFSSKG